MPEKSQNMPAFSTLTWHQGTEELVASWSGDIVLTLPKEFGLRDFVLDMVERKDATTTTFVTNKVGDCHHTTLKELRAGSNDDPEFLGFVAVDIHDAQKDAC